MSAPSRQMLTLLRRPASALAASPSSHRAASSWSLPSLRSLLGQRGSTAKEEREERNKLQNEAAATAASKSEQPKSLFDTRVEQDAEVAAVVRKTSGAQSKPATFHKSSTANFKTSRRKLNDLGRLIAGRTADEAILQLKVSPKKQSSRLLSMLALARDHAIAKGLNRDQLVVAQSWVTKGPYLKRLDIKGRGRYGVKHHPSAKLHVLLAEGQTAEEKRRERKKEQWRSSIRGLTEGDGVGVGKARPLINVGVGGWKW